MFVDRINKSIIYQSINTGFVTAVLGSRRVGKSTLVKHFAESQANQHWIFLNVDHFDVKDQIEQGHLRALIEQTARAQIGQRKVYVVIDEAQKCPALFDQVKALYDEFKDTDKLKFVLTGSGFLSLHELSAESLAGRIELYYLRDFSLQEVTKLLHPDFIFSPSLFDVIAKNNSPIEIASTIQSISPFKNWLLEGLSMQLIWGGLPEVVEQIQDEQKIIYLKNYFQTYLEKDVRGVSGITDLNLYRKLIDVIAEQTGSTRQDGELIEALGCSRDTLKKYRSYLEGTLLYEEIYPFMGSALRRIVKTPKGYLNNNGLISYLTGVDDITILQKTGTIGHRFENWFLKELQVWLDRNIKRSQIYFWRTSSGMEVDFVVEKKPQLFPFEVTFSTRVDGKKIKNLKAFMASEKKAETGYYIYMGDYRYDEAARIHFIPAWAIG